jgi:L-alanine-DL-glutamate epimerase-like enolase superfamily enzyme
VNPIRSLSARALAIPFKLAFAHASATRSATQSIWVEAAGACGSIGYGEGCPREYVTGESLPGALAFVASIASDIVAGVRDLPSLRRWVERNRVLIDAHPAAWCGVELALLDLFGKERNESVEQLLGIAPLEGIFRYTAVLGDASRERFAAELARYRQAGFRDFKIKLAGEPERDAGKIATLQDAGIGCLQTRADANNVWCDAGQAIQALRALPCIPFALEEPLRAGDVAGMARIGETLGCALILDESTARPEQMAHLPAGPRWMLNLRVSKMGGLLRSLAAAERAAHAGLGLIVGAHVGETSLLTRAALTVAHAARDHVVGQEGAFGTHLLERDVVAAPIVFGAGGCLAAAALPRGPGLGLPVSAP